MAYVKQNYQPGDVLTAEQVNKMQDTLVKNEGNIDSHILNKSNPHGVTIAQIGAAPAGYGLGGAKRITVDDLDSTVAPGFYDIASTMTVNNISANYWYMYVTAYGTGTSHCTQVLRPIGAYNCTIERTKKSGVWNEWESTNPPMTLGVEYRTTERYNEKVVYTKLIDFGALPNATSKNVAVVGGATVGYSPVSCEAIITKGFSKYPLPYITNDGEMATISFGGSVVTIETISDMSNCTALVLIKYTKV